jgi:hypothetical protein
MKKAWPRERSSGLGLLFEWIPPLLRGVPIKESSDDETGMWFDIKYEKIPHFCFDCGRMVHPENFCSAQKGGVKQ